MSKKPRPLEDQLLLHLARIQGPLIDRIDLDSNIEGIRVPDLLQTFVKDSGPWPTEVRVALLDLAEKGLVRLGGSFGIMTPHGTASLELRGLVAARKLEPGCGRPTRQITLKMRRGAGVFSAQFDTGQRELDGSINASGLTLAAFYVLAVKRPTKEAPLLLRDCRPFFARLAHLGVGPKGGPGLRLAPSSESIQEAIQKLKVLLALVSCHDSSDARVLGWQLKDSMPEVRIVGASGPQYRDWSWLHFNVGLAIAGTPFVDAENKIVKPLTDEQVDALLADQQKKPGKGDSSADAAGGG